MRLGKVMLFDICFQWKYGFYFLYAFLAAAYVGILLALPGSVRPQAAAILIFSDPGAMGLFFMGAIILLEKSQRVLNAVAVSPLRCSEYIWSKAGSLALISTVVAMVIAIAVGRRQLSGVLSGTMFASVTFTLIGIIAAAKTVSLNQFMLISAGIEAVCFIPPIVAVIRPDWTLLRLFPFDAAMRLIYGSSTSIWLDTGISLLLIAILYPLCHRQVQQMFASVGGVKL